jgi:ABC-type phosphate transport system auxiliary subunit
MISPLHHTHQRTRRLRQFFSRGDWLIWMSGTAIGLAVLLISGLLLLVIASGFTFFWPFQITTAERADGTRVLGVVSATQIERKDIGGQVIKAAQTQF